MDLKNYLKLSRKTVDEFAREAKISNATIFYVQNKEKDIRLTTAKRIVDASGGAVEYEELLPIPVKKKKKKID